MTELSQRTLYVEQGCYRQLIPLTASKATVARKTALLEGRKLDFNLRKIVWGRSGDGDVDEQ